MRDKQIKKETNEKQPWSHKFGEEENLKNRQFSRVARNQKKSVAPLSNVLMIIMLIVVVVPIIFMFWFYNHSKQQTIEPRTAESIMYSRSIAESESMSIVESESLASSLAAEKQSTEESSELDSSQESSSSSALESSSQESSSEVKQVTPDGNYQIYTVKAGDNLYRIALNHGMDLATLKQINGLTGNDISVGMELKVSQQ